MKKLVILLLLPAMVYSQKIFVVKSKQQADVICYITKSKNEADWVVMTTTWESTSRNKGRWMYVKSPNFADMKIFFTNNKNEADKKVYFTRWETDIKQ